MSGDDVRKVRRRLHLTQAELAERLGVTSNTVARWERGEVRITEPAARLIAAQEVAILNAPFEKALGDLRSYLNDASPADSNAAHRKALRALAALNNFSRLRKRENAVERRKGFRRT
jgi:transcriptional regulator with XRE-family HTH domain